jgi:hypothetical protein
MGGLGDDLRTTDHCQSGNSHHWKGLGLEVIVIVRIPTDQIRERHYARLCRFRWDANGELGTHQPLYRRAADVLVPDGAHAVGVCSAAPLFSGGIKEMPVAIGKSTKRGQKKGLFAM